MDQKVVSEGPDHPSRCTWTPNATGSPHTKGVEVADRKKVLPNILHAIGQTPMVRLNNLTKAHGIQCEIFAKCEYLNPGGSVKDRIGFRMVVDYEKRGILKPGATIIEPTSGNTGIGLAMAAAVKGYRCIIVMPEKMSNEKISALRILGAEIVRTPTEAAWDSPEGNIEVAKKLKTQIPNSVIMDQYTNPSNPLAHYDDTATEIFEQCEGKLDYFVGGTGTGGTVSGIARKLKEVSPHTKIVAVDPEGSQLAHMGEEDTETRIEPTFYEVEGIGYDFVPTVLDRSGVDRWIKSNDRESFKIVRELIKREGLLCGGSSGSAVASALKLAKDLPADKRIVVLLPDGIRNYMTKFVSDAWMEARGFLDPPEPIDANKWWWHLPVSELCSDNSLTLPEGSTCESALRLMESTGSSRIPVVDEKQFKGLIAAHTLRSRLIAGTVKPNEPAIKTIERQCSKVYLLTTLGRLSRILETEPYAVIFQDHQNPIFLGIATQENLLRFINDGDKSMSNGTV